MRGYINTIQDLEELYYGAGRELIQKADAPLISTTTGTYNPVFGAYAWSQLNYEANVFGLLPKYPWTRSGFRAKTARISTGCIDGVAENGAIPDCVKPTYAEQTPTLKSMAHPFSVSEVQDYLATESVDDDYLGGVEYMRQDMAIEHKNQVNQALCRDVEDLASYRIESIDRICSSYAESALLSAATDSDVYGDTLRSTSASWKDATCSHNSDVDRDLTDSVLRTHLNSVTANGGRPTVIITGHDTYAAIQGLYLNQMRYDGTLGKGDFSVGVNGIQTQTGMGFGVNVATLYGYPLIVSHDCPQDTLSRIYTLDTSGGETGEPRLGLKIAKPTQYFETGMKTGDPFGINRLGNEGMYRIMGELVCTFFKAQGKIRDLK